MNENIQNKNNKEQNENASQPQDTNIDPNLNSKQENNENETQLLETIKQFFGGPFKDESNTMHDISYTTWVEKEINIKKLCTPFEVVLPTAVENENNNPFGVLTRHDYGYELKLIKWITEDEMYNFIKVGNKGIKINRYNDILPYTYNAVPLDLNIAEKNIDNYINASYINDPIRKK